MAKFTDFVPQFTVAGDFVTGNSNSDQDSTGNRNLINVSSLKKMKNLCCEESINEEEDGLKTPTDQTIPAIRDCPPAPKKPKCETIVSIAKRRRLDSWPAVFVSDAVVAKEIESAKESPATVRESPGPMRIVAVKRVRTVKLMNLSLPPRHLR